MYLNPCYPMGFSPQESLQEHNKIMHRNWHENPRNITLLFVRTYPTIIYTPQINIPSMYHPTATAERPQDGGTQRNDSKRFESFKSLGGGYIGVLRMRQSKSVRAFTEGNLWDITEVLSCLVRIGALLVTRPISLGLNTGATQSIESAKIRNDLSHLPKRRGFSESPK